MPYILPERAAAWLIASASPAVTPAGLSQRTCLPAFNARIAIAGCCLCGVTMIAASKRSSSSYSASSPRQIFTDSGRLARAQAAFASLLQHTAARLSPSISPLPIIDAYFFPIVPIPMTAQRTGFFTLLLLNNITPPFILNNAYNFIIGEPAV